MTSRNYHLDRAAVALVSLLTLSACGGSKPAATAKVEMTPPASVAPTLLSGDVPTPSLPIQAYKQTDSQNHQINNARLTVMRSCMMKLGFDYPPVSSFPRDTSGNALPQDAFRYGPVSMKEADDGYKYAAIQVAQNAASQPAKPVASAAENAALTGDDQHPGCAKQAASAITANGGTLDTSDLVSNIDQQSFQKAQNSPQLQAAFKAWSACMSAKGFAYSTPIDPLRSPDFSSSGSDTSGIPTPSAAEVATAKADVQCKSSSGVIGIWVSLETSMQNQAIEQNAEALKQLKDEQAATLRNAAKILGQ